MQFKWVNTVIMISNYHYNIFNVMHTVGFKSLELHLGKQYSKYTLNLQQLPWAKYKNLDKSVESMLLYSKMNIMMIIRAVRKFFGTYWEFVFIMNKAQAKSYDAGLLAYLPWCWSKYSLYSLLFALMWDLPTNPWKHGKNWTVSFLFLFQ